MGDPRRIRESRDSQCVGHGVGALAVECRGSGDDREVGYEGAFGQVDRPVARIPAVDDLAGTAVGPRGLESGAACGSRRQGEPYMHSQRQGDLRGLRMALGGAGAGLVVSRLQCALVRILIAALFLGISVTASAGVIPSGSIVFVEDAGYFDDLVRAEIIRQKLPIRLVTSRPSAEYILRGMLGTGSDVAFSSVELVEAMRGEIVWADSATRRIGIWKFSRSPKATKVIRQIVGRLKRALK